jgi:hypothetical protein
MTFFLRMSGSKKEHVKRFFCSFYRTTVLFWNIQYTPEIVLVLDDDMKTDHDFGELVTKQFNNNNHNHQQLWNGENKTNNDDDINNDNDNDDQKNLYQIHVAYEPLSNATKTMLQRQAGPDWLHIGYKRQLWSSFFSDTYLPSYNENDDTTSSDDDDKDDKDEEDDTLLVFMDNDAMFVSPVTLSSIFDENHKPRVLGTDCTFLNPMVLNWRYTAEQALGVAIVADFMIYFPVFIYASTIRHCRNYILKRFNVTLLEDAYPQFQTNRTQLSPITVLMNYAWHYERDRYAWSFANCGYHQYLVPNEEVITPDYLHDRVAVPQTAFHQTYAMSLTKLTHAGYCLALQYGRGGGRRKGEKSLPLECLQPLPPQPQPQLESSSSWISRLFRRHRARLPRRRRRRRRRQPLYTLEDQYVFFYHDLQRLQERPDPHPCGSSPSVERECQTRLRQHYREYAHEVKSQNRPVLDWQHTERVSTMAKEVWNITCPSLLNGYGSSAKSSS